MTLADPGTHAAEGAPPAASSALSLAGRAVLGAVLLGLVGFAALRPAAPEVSRYDPGPATIPTPPGPPMTTRRQIHDALEGHRKLEVLATALADLYLLEPADRAAVARRLLDDSALEAWRRWGPIPEPIPLLPPAGVDLLAWKLHARVSGWHLLERAASGGGLGEGPVLALLPPALRPAVPVSAGRRFGRDLSTGPGLVVDVPGAEGTAPRARRKFPVKLRIEGLERATRAFLVLHSPDLTARDAVSVSFDRFGPPATTLLLPPAGSTGVATCEIPPLLLTEGEVPLSLGLLASGGRDRSLRRLSRAEVVLLP